ncbi:family 16 glycoside hydrolase [Mesotoga sp. B105.6.4]|uniref:family 16 glycoside hydrolase n=1 Tax=Mesotoga sp. B105.6.4 TaxID=1582224 RepID=UPI0015E07C4C|nr:family 16 glycoside hydrolase [Mesotoga sp. B105.6.4]
MKKGFSLVELLIVLAVIGSIIAVSTPLALNAMRKARATAVASDFKTLSRAISSSIYLGDGIPSSVDSLGRNVSSDYGVAWSDNEGVYDFVIFTNKEVDTSTLYTLLTNTGSGFPAGEYEFLPGGAASSENSKAYYHVYLDGSGNQTVSSGLNLSFTGLNRLPFVHSTGTWNVVTSGIMSNPGDGNQSRGILDVDENWKDYDITVNLYYTGQTSESQKGGYAVFFRATGENAHSKLSAYAFKFDVTKKKFEFSRFSGYNETVIASSQIPSNIIASDGDHTIKISARGQNFTFYFNGNEVFTATDSSESKLTNGRVGLRAWHNTSVIFKNVTIKPL